MVLYLVETLLLENGSLELKLGSTSFETGQVRAFQRPDLWGKGLEIYFGFLFPWQYLESNGNTSLFLDNFSLASGNCTYTAQN